MLVVLLVSGLAATFPGYARAQDAGGVTLSVRGGLDSYCKDNQWIPLQVTVENQGAGLEGTLEVKLGDSGSTLSAAYAQQVSLPNLARKVFWLYVYPLGYTNELQVRLVDGAGKQVTSSTVRLTCLGRDEGLVGVMSANLSAYNVLSRLDPNSGRASLAQLSPETLPDQAAGLAALDLLVIGEADTGSLSSRQRAALTGWLADGGLLIVTGGPNWRSRSAGLSDLLPLQVEGTMTVSDLDALGEYAGRASPPGEAVIAQGRLTPGANALVDQFGTLLVAAKAVGHGRVYYLAADPGLEPLRNWNGIETFYQRLLSENPTPPSWAGGIKNSDQAVTAVSTLLQLDSPAPGLIVSFLGLYVLAIGPLNYLLLGRLKRRELGWVTIPALILLFSGLAFLLGSNVRGNQPIINQVSVVQVWPGVEQARVDGLVGVFSPGRSTYDLQVGPQLLVRPIANGPMLANPGGWVFKKDEQGAIRIPELRIDVAGLNAVTVEGSLPAPQIEHQLSFRVDARSASLSGSLTNQSGLKLEDAMLLAPGKAVQLGTLEAGERRDIQVSFQETDQALASQPGINGFPATVYTGGRFPGTFNSQTVSDLVGGGMDYNNKRAARRYALAHAITSQDYSSTGFRGAGVYLAGWSDVSPLDASLENQKSRQEGATLYLFALDVTFPDEPGKVWLPPALFTWSMLDFNAQGNASPYQGYLYSGSFSAQFTPVQPLAHRAVDSLTLHLESFGNSGATGIAVDLWDFTAAAWMRQQITNWGDFTVPQPQRFVAPDGSVRLRVESTNPQLSTNYERIDFTLVVER